MSDSHIPEFSSDARERLLFAIKSLCEIGEQLSGTEDFSSSSNSILHLIMGTVVISKAAVMLFDEKENELYVTASRGIEDTDIRLSVPPRVLKALHHRTTPVRLAEPGNEQLEEYFASIEDELVDLHSHVWLPLHVKSRFLGVISVSRKFMNQEYEPVDLELLNIISQQLSIALNNFYLIKDLKQTNFQLNRKLLEQETLFDLGIAIASIMEKHELADTILFNAVGITDASSGFLALYDGDALTMESSINVAEEDEAALCEFAESKEINDAGKHYLDNSSSRELEKLGLRKILLVPIAGQHETQGVIGLADKESRDGIGNFEDADVRLLKNFGSQAGVAIENAQFYSESLEKERLERELSVAATIQRSILPDEPPEIEGLEIAATTIPSRYVGGDHYDFIERDDSYLFTVADVSGKGIPAALLVSTLHATQHALFNLENCPRSLVSKISKSIYKSSLSNKFITYFLIQYFPEEQRLVTVNAGHNPPYIISSGGEMRLLKKGGLVLGLMPEVEYESEETQIHPGDLLVTFTDGVTEAMNEDDEEYGEERLEKLLLKHRDKSARELFDLVMEDVEEFTGGASQHDDITLVLFKFAE
jgi:sigma-B regulation protein RsbU (phosphoserine phosphatase)